MYNWKLFTLQLLSRHPIQRYLSLSSICKFNDISLFEYVKLKMFSISHTFRGMKQTLLSMFEMIKYAIILMMSAYLLPAKNLSIFGIFQLLQYLSLWFSLIWLGQNYVLNRLFSLFLQEDFLLLFENVIHMIHSFFLWLYQLPRWLFYWILHWLDLQWSLTYLLQHHASTQQFFHPLYLQNLRHGCDDWYICILHYLFVMHVLFRNAHYLGLLHDQISSFFRISSKFLLPYTIRRM